jgi:predicted phosphohydrolase/predicted kinase
MKIWHISDPHLSMDENMQPIKKMHERRWAIGSWTFVNYLEAIADFAKENISENDVTFITGDITHDMYGRSVFNSLNWLRATIPGHIVICRGNHDASWRVGDLKLSLNVPRFHIIGENEIMQLGPYVIGCYSDHSLKTEDMEKVNKNIVSFAKDVVNQSKGLKNPIPVLIGHYPQSISTAELIGAAGIKAYMSGHVHCTAGQEPEAVNGILWKWYDISAGLTDDKIINGCFFSTGTVDVLRAKHGQPFKEIKSLEQNEVPTAELDKYRAIAAKVFGCNIKATDKFNMQDPLNKDNHVSGIICREKGLMQGSLLITHVNGIVVKQQLIHGTPKLAYPYKSYGCKDYKDVVDYEHVYFAEKWNGMNVLFYKYLNAENTVFMTAKSKGRPFLNDSPMGNFLSLTKEVLFKNDTTTQKIVQMLEYHEVSAVSAELCGKKEPHLVEYNFDIDLKPLFIIKNNGAIQPIVDNQANYFTKPIDVIAKCKQYQLEDFNSNLVYRKFKNLPHKYEYEHFAVEGKVMYLLDKNFEVIDRTLYKVKPSDIEEVHWQNFDATMQGRVDEAVKKILSEDQVVTNEALQSELDMGPKEWGKFGDDVMHYYNKHHLNSDSNKNKSKMIILVGLPGSGKSTVATELEKHGFIRINQDDLGSRNACKKATVEAIKQNKNVVIDRCNFDLLQRKSWLDLAKNFKLTNVSAVVLDVPADVCTQRAITRENHPTIKDAETAIRVVNDFNEKLVLPNTEEKFDNIVVYKNDSVDNIVKGILEIL